MPAQRTKDTPLEVSIDSPPPQPPALSIIAPTPRAFTFPASHNLTDSPYSSPSNSPFDPDRRPSLISNSSSIDRSLSPDNSIPTPPPTQHKRRKSSSDVERRPKKGDEDYVKRPENAFILFRRKCVEDRHAAEEAAAADGEGPCKKQRQAELSKEISARWKSLSPEDRQYWDNLAKEKKREHEKMYPDYVYRPQRTKRAHKGKKGGKDEEDHDSVHFILPSHSSSRHGRSASAPTPPLYTHLTFPDIFAPSGSSCPTSPSLLPMIHRRGSSGDDMLGFDYIPRDNLMPPSSFGPMPTYESSDMMHSVYNQQIPNEATSNLPHLALSQEQNMFVPQVVSPPSSIGSSSGPSSPHAGPYTPTSTVLASSFSQMPHADRSACQASTGGDQQDQMHLQMYQQQQQDLDLAGYAWDNSSLWGSATNTMVPDDFDISAIPPIELGVPKFDDQMVVGGHPQYSGEYPQQPLEGQFDDSQLNNGIVNFDDVIGAGPSF